MGNDNVVYTPNGIYSAIKQIEILSFVTKWLELKIITLIDISLKDEYCIISLACGI